MSKRVLIGVTILGFLSPVDADTFTTSYTDGGTWNTVYAQGFSPSLNTTPDLEFALDDTVHLDRFQFFKSGMQDEAEVIQLAILDNIFYNFFTLLTTDSPELVGLSSNVIMDTLSLETGDAITFAFDSLPLTYGDSYGAVFVEQDAAGLLSPVTVSALTADYMETEPGSGVWVPITNYGTEEEFQFSTTNWVSDEGFFRSFEFAGDANFVATFNTDILSSPCDFDSNGICDTLDIDALLYDGIVNNDTTFDVDENGTVDLADRDRWLVDAGTKENRGTPYVLGDADLDGDVDTSDLNVVGVNWRQIDAASWAQADFNGDEVVDAADLNSLGINWLSGVTAPANAVPEPSGTMLTLTGIVGLLVGACRSRRQFAQLNIRRRPSVPAL